MSSSFVCPHYLTSQWCHLEQKLDEGVLLLPGHLEKHTICFYQTLLTNYLNLAPEII